MTEELKFESRVKNFLFFIESRPPEAHPASYPMGTGTLSLRVKWLGREVDHLPSSSAGVKKMWPYTSIPPTCLHGIVLK
jgi:hypothetical protein